MAGVSGGQDGMGVQASLMSAVQDLGLVEGGDYLAYKRVADNVFRAEVNYRDASYLAEHLDAFFKA